MLIAICDDMQDQVRLTHFAAKKYFAEKKIDAKFNLYTDAYKFLNDVEEKTPFDVVLLDICMPGIMGTNIAAQLRKERIPAEIVFLTGSDEYAVEAFSIGVAHYLLKPFTMDQFNEAMDRVMDNIRLRHSRRMIFKVEGGIRVIEIDQIQYIESEGHILTVHLSGGDSLQTRLTLTALKDNLDTISPGQFVVPSKGYLVNRKAIRAIKTGGIEIGGAVVPISRGGTKKFQEEYFEYIFSV